MTEYTKIEDMPIGASLVGISMSESSDSVTPLEFPVSYIETDGEKGFVFIYKNFNSPLRAEVFIARGTWVEWEKRQCSA